MEDIEVEARAQGPEAERHLELLNTYYSVCADLLSLRAADGRSQPELSEATGLSQADISRIERGKANPTLATLIRLVYELGGEFRIHPRRSGRPNTPAVPRYA